jgi:squalene synthase HpnC
MIRRVIFESARGVAELDGVEQPVGAFSLAESYAFCERIARGHFDSYALARRFVPEAMRPHVWALYAFARSADDFADEPRYDGRRRELLTDWEDKLERAFHGDAEHPIFIALADTVEKCELPITPLRDLLNAYVIDLSVTRYATAAQLDCYAGLAAHPIGRLFLHLFGQSDPCLHRFSDEICTAVQIAKVCQDVSLDLMRDRVYLPAEDLRHFGVTEAMLQDRSASGEVRDLIRYQVMRARCLLERGRPLIDRLRRIDGGLAFQVALIYHSTAALLEQIERADFDVLARRPRLGNAEKADVLVRASSARWPNVVKTRRVG